LKYPFCTEEHGNHIFTAQTNYNQPESLKPALFADHCYVSECSVCVSVCVCVCVCVHVLISLQPGSVGPHCMQMFSSQHVCPGRTGMWEPVCLDTQQECVFVRVILYGIKKTCLGMMGAHTNKQTHTHTHTHMPLPSPCLSSEGSHTSAWLPRPGSYKIKSHTHMQPLVHTLNTQ